MAQPARKAAKKSASKNTNKIAFQGKAGAYSDIACRKAFPGCEPLPCPSFLDAFIALDQGKADLAMIPIDNSIAGRVADIHHLLPQYPFYFVAEHFLPIDHCLVGLKDAKVEDIKKVYSHAHALPQCRKIIRQHRWEPIVYGDTAGAAERVAQLGDKTNAAIASSLTAELYGLKILKRDIADEKNNITRFLALSRKPGEQKREAKKKYITSFIFSVKNMPAALYKALGGFATNGVNMLKLESYMPDGGFAATLFYGEVEGHQDEAPLAQALKELTFYADGIRVLGSYAQHRGVLKRKPVKK
jgi:prephenate dehydratase